MTLQRLKTRLQFQAVLAGAVVAKTTHFSLHCNVMDAERIAVQFSGKSDAQGVFGQQIVWIGAMVPKRWARPAVTRNLIKRQIYSVSADFLQQHAPAAFVVRLRRGFARAEYFSASSAQLRQAVRAELQVLMHAGAGTS